MISIINLISNRIWHDSAVIRQSKRRAVRLFIVEAGISAVLSGIIVKNGIPFEGYMSKRRDDVTNFVESTISHLTIFLARRSSLYGHDRDQRQRPAYY